MPPSTTLKEYTLVDRFIHRARRLRIPEWATAPM
jgi:hypothetical protein